MNYNVKVTVKNSQGYELVKRFNFTTVESMEYCDMYRILYKVAKENYHLEINDGHKHPCRNKPISFEELCSQLLKWRFTETRTTSSWERIEKWSTPVTMVFPCNMFLNTFFHSEWDGTFFELEPSEDSLMKVSFEKVKDFFEKHGMDLHKSKTEGLWYTHEHIDIILDAAVPHGCHVMIRKRYFESDFVRKVERVEL